jgi:hypothetical protein
MAFTLVLATNCRDRVFAEDKGVVLDDIVVETLGQQRDLVSVFAFDKSLHVGVLKKPDASV